jgi:hypothetical protein
LVELDKKNIEHKLFSSDFTFEDSSVFKELMSLYPWCTSFTVVYLKSLSNTDDMRFPNELEEYAAQLNSREVVYDLLHGFESNKTRSVESKRSLIEHKDDAPLVPKIDDKKTTKAKESNEDLLEKMMVSKIVSDQLINEIANEVKEEEVTIENKEPEVASSRDAHHDHQINKSQDESPKTFSAWLRMGNDSSSDNTKKDYLTFEKPKKDFFSAQTSAKESLQVKNIPVSETLAKVFESQGNYSMAISTYEQLILIFPEKKIFFADQIKKIKIKTI